MYSSKNIGFIISEVDTVAFYEKKGQENVQKVWEEAASKMSQMNRVQQMEIIQGRMFPFFRWPLSISQTVRALARMSVDLLLVSFHSYH